MLSCRWLWFGVFVARRAGAGVTISMTCCFWHSVSELFRHIFIRPAVEEMPEFVPKDLSHPFRPLQISMLWILLVHSEGIYHDAFTTWRTPNVPTPHRTNPDFEPVGYQRMRNGSKRISISFGQTLFCVHICALKALRNVFKTSNNISCRYGLANRSRKSSHFARSALLRNRIGLYPNNRNEQENTHANDFTPWCHAPGYGNT